MLVKKYYRKKRMSKINNEYYMNMYTVQYLYTHTDHRIVNKQTHETTN